MAGQDQSPELGALFAFCSMQVGTPFLQPQSTQQWRAGNSLLLAREFFKGEHSTSI